MNGERASWEALRLLRNRPPRLAMTGARLRTFRVALQQAESLWQVSGEVGPSVSPMLLYRGIVQAGRALCAALDPSPLWESTNGSGVNLVDPKDLDTGHGLGEIRVAVSGSGLAHQVASVLQSPTLNTDVSIVDLIGSLSTTSAFVDDSAIARPINLQLDDLEAPSRSNLTLAVSPLPASLSHPRQRRLTARS